jgi:hypothetical protein
LNKELYPYVVFLPGEEKNKVLSAIFGSKAAVDLLKFSLEQGSPKTIYKKTRQKLNYSNQTSSNPQNPHQIRVIDEAMGKKKRKEAETSGSHATASPT